MQRHIKGQVLRISKCWMLSPKWDICSTQIPLTRLRKVWEEGTQKRRMKEPENEEKYCGIQSYEYDVAIVFMCCRSYTCLHKIIPISILICMRKEPQANDGCKSFCYSFMS